jgi:hypothetical protein
MAIFDIIKQIAHIFCDFCPVFRKFIAGCGFVIAGWRTDRGEDSGILRVARYLLRVETKKRVRLSSSKPRKLIKATRPDLSTL